MLLLLSLFPAVVDGCHCCRFIVVATGVAVDVDADVAFAVDVDVALAVDVVVDGHGGAFGQLLLSFFSCLAVKLLS